MGMNMWTRNTSSSSSSSSPTHQRHSKRKVGATDITITALHLNGSCDDDDDDLISDKKGRPCFCARTSPTLMLDKILRWCKRLCRTSPTHAFGLFFMLPLALLCWGLAPLLSLISLGQILVKGAFIIHALGKAKSVPTVVSHPIAKPWKEPLSSEELFGGDTRIIWGVWDKGADSMPTLCQHAVRSWKVRNPLWKVVILDSDNYRHYVSVSDLPTTTESLRRQNWSVLMRVAVLRRYGGVYMDVSTILHKGFDHIWETMEDDKLAVSSFTKLENTAVVVDPTTNKPSTTGNTNNNNNNENDIPYSYGLDLFNNAVMFTKKQGNEALKIWQEQVIQYYEAPCKTREDMERHARFGVVHRAFGDPALGIFTMMIPYHATLWILDDLVWTNEQGIADRIVVLPEVPWGFFVTSLPIAYSQCQEKRRLGRMQLRRRSTTTPVESPSSEALSSSKTKNKKDKPQQTQEDDPSFVPISWKLTEVLTNSATGILPHFLENDAEMEECVLDILATSKFSSEELEVIELGFHNMGYRNSLGKLYLSATNTSLYPIRQATLEGVRRPVTLSSIRQYQQQQ